jgi:predicted metal-dependent phosphoesterase TrpH
LNPLGAPSDPEVILAACRDGNGGRPHIARALIAAGHCASLDEAFDRYLGRDGRAYVTATHLPIEDAMRVAHDAGGVVSLAHPGIEKVDDALPALVELGLDALEAHHPAHSYAETARYIGMCQLLGLQATGGADFHGHPGSAPPGAFGLSSEGLAALRARRRSGPAPAAVLGSAP